jgi:thiol:disulfide interchange protein DsbD
LGESRARPTRNTAANPLRHNPESTFPKPARRRIGDDSRFPRRISSSMSSLMRSAARWLARVAPLVLGTAATMSALAADDFLDPDQAFQVTAKALDDHRIELDYRIAPGYYLYRERFKFDATGATHGDPVIPPGKKKYDTALEQQVETYHDHVEVVIPFSAGPAAFDLVATHQGCAEKGLCYPPQQRTLHVQLKGLGAAANAVAIVKAADTGAPSSSTTAAGPDSTTAQSLRNAILGGPAGAPSPSSGAAAAGGTSASPVATLSPAPQDAGPQAAAASSDDHGLTDALHARRLWLLLPLAFLVGLGLSLTPCVLPMLPILSSIIVGQSEAVTRGRGLALAASYSLGMALVYTALGVVAGLLGEGLAAYLQKPAVLITFGLLLGVLSLSMFGLYELQLPSALRDRLNARNSSLSGGQMGGVFVMGVLSALIVSPCVSAPLAGVLLFIGQTHDAVLGGLGLFMIAAGMSVPLLLVGASAGALLPRGGAWMNRVKLVFGLLLLGVAIYLMTPALPAIVTMIAWGLLFVIGGSAMGAFEPAMPGPHMGAARLFRGVALILVLFGAMQFIGMASGSRDPLQPLARFAQAQAATVTNNASALHFDRVSNLADLDARIKASGKPVLLDFYADWCVSCKEMEAQTFTDPAVRAKLDTALLLRADVTANSDDDRALLKRFQLFGPPGIIFFDAQGRESVPARVVGFQEPPRFLQSLASAGL